MSTDEDRQSCRVIRRGDFIELHSPWFLFRLTVQDGLRAVDWENRITGCAVSLGSGPELEVDVAMERVRAESLPSSGDTRGAFPTLEFLPTAQPSESPANEALFELRSAAEEMTARITYTWDREQPVLRKHTEVTNRSGRELWLVSVRLGTYASKSRVIDREQGFPAYIDDGFYIGVAHPAGWAMSGGNGIVLRHHPGIALVPGATYRCMEAVYGVSQAGEARREFVEHVRGRMRRVLRGHDRPYAIYSPFGAQQPEGSYDESEAFLLDMIAKVGEGQRESGCRFDLFSIDFWVDYYGDLKKADPKRFPRGLEPVLRELRKLGVAPGLWIDSSWELWSIGGNPLVKPCLNYDATREESLKSVPGFRASLCRATEPIRSMYIDAFRYHVRVNGVRMLKFDNFSTLCENPEHAHLPGMYSTESIVNAAIEFFREIDEECPEVFILLYWGYRSPWWLLHADTYFDSGLGIEAATPSDFPAPYARDSMTQKLDQAQWFASDTPALGKDTLGVWLSDWDWNSEVGKERWQEAMVMDICRGTMLVQPWSDAAWLSPPERRQMAVFIDLLKAKPQCFGNPRQIVGSPLGYGPYGYCCTDGSRAFLAVNNCTWEDRLLTIELNPSWGLPHNRRWDLYRWYPHAARLTGEAQGFGSRTAIALRPFQVVLLEAVPAGDSPALPLPFESRPIPALPTETGRPLPVQVEIRDPAPIVSTESMWRPLLIEKATSTGGAAIAVRDDGALLAGGNSVSRDVYTILARTDLASISAILLEVLPDESLPGNGPGRGASGNFALEGIHVEEVALIAGKPVTDYSHGAQVELPLGAWMSSPPQSLWSIDRAEGEPHVAMFATSSPAAVAGGARLTIELTQGEQGLGCFRLWATSALKPLLPDGFGVRRWIVRGVVPACRQSGFLALHVDVSKGRKPFHVQFLGDHFATEGSAAGGPIELRPVLARHAYPSCWQAWRLELGSSDVDIPFAITVELRGLPKLDCHWGAHFVPG